MFNYKYIFNMAKRLSKKEIEKLHDLYLEGNTCEKIGKITGHSIDTVTKYLKKDYGIIPKSKIDINKLRELVLQGKTTKECSKYFNVYPSAISFWKKKLNDDVLNIAESFSKRNVELTNLQLQMILGSLLGDMSIGKIRHRHPTCRLYLVHSSKQKELFMKKVEILGEWMGAYKEYNTFDSRTKKVYSTFRGSTKAHSTFNQIRNLLYPNGIKTITKEYLNLINHPIALAYWFMDDGTNRGVLSTNCFTYEEVQLLSNWLTNKWNINNTIQTHLNKNKEYYTIYITMYSRKSFEQLIIPYVIPSMYYKLKFSELAKSVNSVNSGEALEHINTK